MRHRLLIVLIPAVLTALVLNASPAWACDPPSDGVGWRYGWCMKVDGGPRSDLSPTPIQLALPRGDDPTTAREVSDAWQALDPGTSIWYKTTYSESFRVLEFWLETASPDTISVAFFSPDQTPGLSAATKPVGRGTHSKSDPDTILRWKAGYARPGVWYILLTNDTNAPAPYKLNHNQQTTGVKKCVSYWEYLPNGDYVLWTDCGFYTGPKD